MTMAKRRKALKQRLYTYDQLNAKFYRAMRAGAPSPQEVWLYGRVGLDYRGGGRMQNGIVLMYRGRHGTTRLATVYRLLDGGTMYTVHGVGKKRNKKLVRYQIDKWERYAPAFTPQTTRLYEGEQRHYLLRDGKVTSLGQPLGAWLTMPSAMVPKPREWSWGGRTLQHKFRSFQNFPRRCLLFATRLRQALAEDGLGEVQLRNNHDWGYHWQPEGNTLHVCTPPSTGRDGRQLVVHIAMHDTESRKFHHSDGDWGVKHSQFFALERGQNKSHMLRWKCARDAINGVKEWIIGDIYIPGPG
jgi:hypothetical protein